MRPQSSLWVRFWVRLWAKLWVTLWAALTGALLAGAFPAHAQTAEDCFEIFTKGKGAEIACSFPTRMTDQERSEVRSLTRSVLQDASCLVAIKIERQLVDQALTAADLVFTAPPQPVDCDLVTTKGTLKISGTFAPRITFKNGKAVDASPGLGNVKGVSRVISLPVELWVNRGGTIRDGMVKVVNAYKQQYGPKTAAQN
jgi:hypothetical protein